VRGGVVQPPVAMVAEWWVKKVAKYWRTLAVAQQNQNRVKRERDAWALGGEMGE